MTAYEAKSIKLDDQGFPPGDDDRRRYQRRQIKDRRELIRFDLNHAKRRSGNDRRANQKSH